VRALSAPRGGHRQMAKCAAGQLYLAKTICASTFGLGKRGKAILNPLAQRYY